MKDKPADPKPPPPVPGVYWLRTQRGWVVCEVDESLTVCTLPACVMKWNKKMELTGPIPKPGEMF